MKDKIRMIIFVIILGTISSGVLTAINFYSKQIIKRNEELKLKSSIMESFHINYKKRDIEKIFTDRVTSFKKDIYTFYKSHDNEIAFEFSGSGLWGPITGIIALQPDLETVKGITITHQEETPGLGARITEKEFLDSFRGKKIVPGLQIMPSNKKAIEANQVDGITGATMTGKALEDLLNNEIIKHKEVLKK